jgi:hypothetical protein
MGLKIELDRDYLSVGIVLDGTTIGTIVINKFSDVKKCPLVFEFSEQFKIIRIYSEEQLKVRDSLNIKRIE